MPGEIEYGHFWWGQFDMRASFFQPPGPRHPGGSELRITSVEATRTKASARMVDGHWRASREPAFTRTRTRCRRGEKETVKHDEASITQMASDLPYEAFAGRDPRATPSISTEKDGERQFRQVGSGGAEGRRGMANRNLENTIRDVRSLVVIARGPKDQPARKNGPHF